MILSLKLKKLDLDLVRKGNEMNCTIEKKTGKIRGLLCHCCNAHLAWLENKKTTINKHLGVK